MYDPVSQKVKIIDFGTAIKIVSNKAQRLAGTKSYMSP